jgi:hypothetical protein
MKEVSPKYGDGAEVNVEDVDSTDVQVTNRLIILLFTSELYRFLNSIDVKFRIVLILL